MYAASEGLRTVLVERRATGGQAGQSSRIENYLGFPDGISGTQLTNRAHRQAQKFGAEILTTRDVVGLDVRTIVTGRSLRRRWSGRRPRRAPGDGDLLPQARRPGRRGVDRPRCVLRVGGHGGHGVRGRRGLHRRRRQLGRTGGRLLRPPCPARHDARTGQHPRGVDVALPRPADRRDPDDRGPARQRGDRRRGRRAPRSTDRPQPVERGRRDDEGGPPVRVHRRRPPHGVARRRGRHATRGASCSPVPT